MIDEKIVTMLDVQNLRTEIANIFKKQSNEIDIVITANQQIFIKTDVVRISDEHLLKISEFTGFKFKLINIEPYNKGSNKLTHDYRQQLEFIYTDLPKKT